MNLNQSNFWKYRYECFGRILTTRIAKQLQCSMHLRNCVHARVIILIYGRSYISYNIIIQPVTIMIFMIAQANRYIPQEDLKEKYRMPRIDRIETYCKGIKSIGLATNLQITVKQMPNNTIHVMVTAASQSPKEEFDKAVGYVLGEFVKVYNYKLQELPLHAQWIPCMTTVGMPCQCQVLANCKYNT